MKKILLFLCVIGFLGVEAQQIGGKNSTIQVIGNLRADSLMAIPTKAPLLSKRRVGSMYYEASDSSVRAWTGSQYRILNATGGGTYIFDANHTIAGINIGIDTTSKIASFYRLTRVRDSLGARIDALVLAAGGSGGQINTTYAALDGSTQLDSSKVYFVTDSLRRGAFYYYGYSVNQTPDNGAVDIVNTAGQIWHRVYSGAVDAAWFDIRQNSIYANSNTTNMRKARDYIAKTKEKLVLTGNYTFSDSIQFPSTALWSPNVECNGITKFIGANGYGFVFANQYKPRFTHFGLLDGPYTGLGVDSTSYANRVGAGLWLKSAWNGTFYVNEITGFRNGIYSTGGNGIGGQLNDVTFVHIHHNWAQIHLTTLGTSFNYNNQNSFHGGQLGSGVNTNGSGGWYGTLIDRDPSSNSTVTGISGTNFYNIDHEGLRTGTKWSYTSFNQSTGGSYEPGALLYHMDLDTAIASGAFYNSFGKLQTFNSDFIPNGRGGIGTDIQTNIFSSPGNLGGTEMTMLKGTKRFLLKSSEYTGFTPWNVDQQNDLYSITGQNIPTEAGMNRFGGVIRKFPYKGQLLSVGNSTGTADDTLTAPANLGYVLLNTNEAKVIRINAGDISGTSYETFTVEYVTALGLTFINGNNNAVLIAPGQFTTAGMYTCTYRAGSYKVDKAGSGTGGSGSWTVSGSNQYSAVSGNVGFGVTSPTGKIDIVASNGSVGSAPIHFNAGTLEAAYRQGALQFDGNYLYIGANGQVEKIATDKNVMAFVNKTGFKTLAYSQTAAVNVVNTTTTAKTSILQGGAYTFDPLFTDLKVGDVVTFEGGGELTVPGSPVATATFEFDCGSYANNLATVKAGQTNYNSAAGVLKDYKYKIVVTILSVGTSATAFMDYQFFLTGEDSPYAGGYVWNYSTTITGVNTLVPSYNLRIQWNNNTATHSWSAFSNTVKVDRK